LGYTLKELLGIPKLQELLDSLNEIHCLPSAIIDIDGNILTATAWQDICAKFHRVNPDTEKRCIESDRHIGARLDELASHKGEETILLAEDEPSILEMTARLLTKLGYRVLKAGGPGAAIRLAREHHGDISLLMTDVIMPEMNGRELAKSILSIYPRVKRLFMSGYTADIIAHHGVLD
jgi:CheY-like chemotaxis protein